MYTFVDFASRFEFFFFQPFKFLHAVRLVEAGLSSQAQDYCKQIAEFVVANPTKIVTDFLPDFLTQLEHLSDKLKYQVIKHQISFKDQKL